MKNGEKKNMSGSKTMTGYPSIDKTHLQGTAYFERHPYIPNISISNALDFMFSLKGNTPAIECLDLHITHLELREDAVILSKAFLQLGVKAGDIICVSMPNYYQAVVAFKAANRIGAVITYLNPFASEEELKKYLNMYKARILLNYDKDLEYNRSLRAGTTLKYIITLHENLLNIRSFQQNKNVVGSDEGFINYHNLSSIAERWKGHVKTGFAGKQEALILYTSGSTGEPKSMVFTNENILSTLIYYKNTIHPEKATDLNRRWMCVVPFMYPYGFAMSVLVSLLGGYEAVLAPNIGPENIAQYYKKQPYLIFGSPAFLELTKRNLPADVDLSSLRIFISGGDFLSPSQAETGKSFFKQHNADVDICNGSGNGELLGCCTTALGAPIRPETVGRLVVGPKYIILDPDTDKEVHYGEPGILCAAGKHVFKGYYNNEELTTASMIVCKGKKYYKTGNFGFLDEDGYFTMIGRASRFYINNSLNKVYCELVQSVINQIDIVDACAVVPMPNKDSLYVSKAYVVLKQGIPTSETSERYIMHKSREPYKNPATGEMVVLKEYEAPASISFLNELPRIKSSDKIDYRKLEEMAKSDA